MATENETRLRELLSAVEAPPSRLTAPSLVHRGRQARRRRHRLLATGAAGVATLGVVSAIGLTGRHPAPPPELGGASTGSPFACTVRKLALPAGATAGEVNDSSPSGRYLAGFFSGEDNPGKPLRWDGGRALPIPIDGIGEAKAVNDSGVVVGEGQTADRRHTAWAYVDGKVVELPVPKGYTGAEATAINGVGKIAGVLLAEDRTAPVVWQAPSATAPAQVLDAPGGGTAFGISDSGVVVGGRGETAYRWDANGRGAELPGVAAGEALGIRGDWAFGLATGDGKPSGNGSGPQTIDGNAAVVWNLRTGQAAVEDRGRVEAVNTTGQATVDHPGKNASIRMADGTLHELPALPGTKKAYATSLSDDGKSLAGSSADAPVRWSCTGR
jgi:probable HAF family extracellular repeat protein